MVVCSDASFANVGGTESQGGHIIYVTDGQSLAFPLAWQSHKLKRVAKSTHAAETLAMVDAAESAVFLRMSILELLSMADIPRNIPIECRTDSAALRNSVHSCTQILDKRLRIETAILREMVARKEIVDFKWVPTTNQPADALTKTGVSPVMILKGHPE